MSYRYNRILRSDQKLYEAVKALHSENVFESTVNSVIAPVLVMYTNWVISEARKHGIQRLYFLARDGYQMYHIADKICRQNRFNIKCSYFYCSRYSFRMAAYRFFDDTAYKKLFINSYKLTARHMLERAGFNEEERSIIYDEIGFKQKENAVMGRSEFAVFCRHIRNSISFNGMLKEKSERAYQSTISYMHQEEMQKYSKIGIVDLGWTGSLQYTLKKLLVSDDIHSEVYGFYMGMLDTPPKTPNSFYLSWLFDSRQDLIKTWFSHNLIECICSAPHGMTLGYKVLNDTWIPILSKPENYPQLPELIRMKVETLSVEDIGSQKKTALRLLRKLMLSPTEEEANALRCYRFCDDVGEQYHRSIVQKVKPKDFRREILPWKLQNHDSSDGLYWYYGSIQASDMFIKMFYRYMYLFTRYIIMKAKRG